MISVLQTRLTEIQSRIESAALRAGRDAREVVLLAVSKKQPIERVIPLLELGSYSLGENYVQAAEERKLELATYDFAMHLIGPLQRNKAKKAVELFDLIHSVDRESLALEIDKQAKKLGVKQAVLLQVNVSAESSKAGIAPNDFFLLLGLIKSLAHVELQGLMCIGSPLIEGSTEEDSRAEFAMLRKLREEAQEYLGYELPHLSMGMSNDFELAIEEGATIIRVGSALFGPRGKVAE
ncbi:UNVERIFIED_CONTAM: hypothetical protein GTU68_036904 [Idotea baltica]|nr:hypothetical protein [Idotea baltica]